MTVLAGGAAFRCPVCRGKVFSRELSAWLWVFVQLTVCPCCGGRPPLKPSTAVKHSDECTED